MKTIRANDIDLAFHEWVGGDRLALLLHGFPDDAGSMFGLGTSMALLGYHVVAPYLRGYHPSSPAPDGRYDLAALAADVIGLIDALGYRRAVVLGHDWGAMATYAAANLAPERLSAAITLSVPPLRVFLPNLLRNPAQLLRSRYIAFFQVPLLPEWTFEQTPRFLIDALWRRWSPGWEPPAQRLAEVRATFAQGRTARAALSYYRALSPAGRHSSEVYRQTQLLSWRRLQVPTLLLCGARDRCIAPSMYRGLERAFRAHHEWHILPDAGHFLPLEASEAVMAHVRPFLAALGAPAVTPR